MNIGIDFGSTYSTVSKFDPDTNNVEAITFSEGDPASIPSVVSVSRRGQITCGKGAKDQVGKKTVRIFEAFKMLLTEGNQEMLKRRGYDSEYTPRMVTRLFLESTLRGVLQRENHDGSDCDGFENVVICVPEIWNSKPKAWDGSRILREILQHEIQIPVKHVQVVTEPEAASAFIAYNYEKETGKKFNGHLLLIDYGGGTLDLTLTQVTSEGNGAMEIAYREGGGAGENHPDDQGNGNIGSAGIAYMQNVVHRAIVEQGLLEDGDELDYSSPAFLTAVKDLETQMKNSDRIRDIEDTFGSYGSYHKLKRILKEENIQFVFLEYDGEELPVTFQHLYLAYKEVIEPVLGEQIAQINEKVRMHIPADPCEPAAGMRDDFKIALVGGYGSFYLVKQQIAEIYKLDANPEIDLRTKNISANKREQAISLGAALLSAGKVVLQKTARFSIGVYASGTFYYGIKCYQKVEPGKIYFVCRDAHQPDVVGNRLLYGGLYGNIEEFVIEFTNRLNHGGKMKMKQEMLNRMKKLPAMGFWHVGFSMDERDIISFHVVPQPLPGMESVGKEDRIELESYTNLFDLTDIEEVTK